MSKTRINVKNIGKKICKLIVKSKNICILLIMGTLPLYTYMYYGDYISCITYNTLQIDGRPEVSIEKLNELHKFAKVVRFPKTAYYKADRAVTEEEFVKFMNTWVNVASSLKYQQGTFVCVQYATLFRDLMRQLIPNAGVYSIAGFGHCENLVKIKHKDGRERYYIVEPQDTIAIVLQENVDKNGKSLYWEEIICE